MTGPDSVEQADRWVRAAGLPMTDNDVRAWLDGLGVPVPVGIRPLMSAVLGFVIAAGDAGYEAGRASLTSQADPDMAGVWTAIVVDQTGGVWTEIGCTPEPHHRIMVVRALLDVADVAEIQYQQVLYEAQGWKAPEVEWAEAQAVAAALNAVQGRR